MTERRAKPGAMSGAKPAKSGVKPARCGPFVPDLDIPARDGHLGACARCHLIGEQGDAHHPPLPDAPDDDVQRRAAGERGDQ